MHKTGEGQGLMLIFLVAVCAFCQPVSQCDPNVVAHDDPCLVMPMDKSHLDQGVRADQKRTLEEEAMQALLDKLQRGKCLAERAQNDCLENFTASLVETIETSFNEHRYYECVGGSAESFWGPLRDKKATLKREEVKHMLEVGFSSVVERNRVMVCCGYKSLQLDRVKEGEKRLYDPRKDTMGAAFAILYVAIATVVAMGFSYFFAKLFNYDTHRAVEFFGGAVFFCTSIIACLHVFGEASIVFVAVCSAIGATLLTFLFCAMFSKTRIPDINLVGSVLLMFGGSLVLFLMVHLANICVQYVLADLYARMQEEGDKWLLRTWAETLSKKTFSTGTVVWVGSFPIFEKQFLVAFASFVALVVWAAALILRVGFALINESLKSFPEPNLGFLASCLWFTNKFGSVNGFFCVHGALVNVALLYSDEQASRKSAQLWGFFTGVACALSVATGQLTVLGGIAAVGTASSGQTVAVPAPEPTASGAADTPERQKGGKKQKLRSQQAPSKQSDPKVKI